MILATQASKLTWRSCSGRTSENIRYLSPNVLLAGESATWNMLTGNYSVMPNWWVYGGWTSTQSSNDIENFKSANAPIANQVPKARVIALGVDYRIGGAPATAYQDQNAVYFRYENIDKVDNPGRKYNTLMVGVRVGFN